MKNTNNQGTSHDLFLYFIIAFGFTWILWILAPFLSNGDLMSYIWIVGIGSFGPSLSAIIISLRMDSSSSEIKKHKQWIPFITTFIFSLIIAFIASIFIYPITFASYNTNLELNLPSILYIVIASLIPSFIVSKINSPKKKVRELLEPIKGVKGKNLYLMIAIALPLIIVLVSAVISISTFSENISWFELIMMLLIIFLNSILFVGGFTEEIGWRGFAQAELLKKYSPLTSGIIIGIIWSLWHLPSSIFLFTGIELLGIFSIFLYFFFVIPSGIIYAWFYKKSNGNLLGCMILHASFNTFGYILIYFPGAFYYPYIIVFFISLFLIIADKMWKTN